MVHQFKNNGYNIVLDVNTSSVHVVDDLVYDPEWARTHSGNWFARSYDIPDPSGLQNYKALRNKEIAWRYVKI